ncbi:MAG: DUF1549 domain-containing protein, partial [Woeseiaceae bacterium]|nr:DUF1549 domain-containing protein [Woeseiaceae bacterium]
MTICDHIRPGYRGWRQVLPLVGVIMLHMSLELNAEPVRPINFVNDVVPILTKAGCNSGECHAKAGMGQNGFRLSLLGFEPTEDYEHLVKEARSRRIFPAAPDQSLMLLKASNTRPHGGGARLPIDSPDYRLLRTWVSQGLPFARESDPTLVSIEVEPKRNTMKMGATQQLKVLAHYSDKSTRDVSRLALFEANDRAMAEVNATGLVKVEQIPGKVAVMVRYSAKVAVFNASIPLGAPVNNLPPAKNFIDKLVFANLKQIGIPPSAVIDDAAFLRRLSLDVAGRMPTADDAQTFLTN